MIISGGSRSNWRFFAKHLMNTKDNERVRLEEIRGVAGDTALEALRQMNAVASGTRCEKFFYHADLNPRADERLTPEQWERAVDVLEQRLGLEGQPRIVVEHVKLGREHQHVIWSRIDSDSMKAIPDSHNFAKHAAVSRELEREFELQPVRSILAQPDGPRPERRPKNWETFRGKKTGLDPETVKTEITALWREYKGGRAFAVALAERGYALRKGDRRDFCIIDPAGNEHSLARRITGVKAADIRARMKDIDREALPGVAEGRAQRRGDRQRIAAAGSAGAKVAAAINASRVAELITNPIESAAIEQENYAQTFQIRREVVKDGSRSWRQRQDERQRLRDRDTEPER